MSKHNRDRRKRRPEQYVQLRNGTKLAVTGWEMTYTETEPLIDGSRSPVATVRVSPDRPDERTPIDPGRN